MRNVQKQRRSENLIDIFFGIAIFTFCIVSIFAFLILVWNCIDLSMTIKRLLTNYDQYVLAMGVNTQDTNANETYMENLISYTIQLQELESKSTSSNIITFIYTFLSGGLIGVATYLTKKCEKCVKEIQENKELIENLDSRTLFSNLYMYVQRTYSTIQIFDLSLNAIQDRNILEEFVNSNITKINSVINEIYFFTMKNEANIRQLHQLDKKSIVDEINKIGMIINNMRDFESSDSITEIYNVSTRMGWKKKIDEVKRILR